MQESSDACLRQFARWQPLIIGGQPYVPLDVEVSPMDNSKTKKEGCSWTGKHFDGYAPNFADLGHEGYALGMDFREGKQHGQKDTPEFLADCRDRARSILGSSGAALEPAWKLWVRLDSGNDSAENLHVIGEHGGEFLTKRNLRRGEMSRTIRIPYFRQLKFPENAS